LPFWWVEPAIVAAGIVVSIIVAVITIRDNRRLVRLRATIDLISASESETYYRGLYQDFRKYRMDAAYRDGVLDPRDDVQWDHRFACFSYLNHYELIAISCKTGALDEEFYMEWMGYAVLRDFREARGLVDVARSPKKLGDPGDKAAYANLENLCGRWSKRLH